MNFFDAAYIFKALGCVYIPATIRNRKAFALGMRDDRNGNYNGESFVNNGYESDAYWAGREVSKTVGRRGMSVTMALAEISLM